MILISLSSSIQSMTPHQLLGRQLILSFFAIEMVLWEEMGVSVRADKKEMGVSVRADKMVK